MTPSHCSKGIVLQKVNGAYCIFLVIDVTREDGLYTLPGGKGVYGETPDATFQREMGDELGLAETAYQYREVLEEIRKGRERGVEYDYKYFVYALVLGEDEEVNDNFDDGTRHFRVGKFPLGQLPENTHPDVGRIIKAWAEQTRAQKKAH